MVLEIWAHADNEKLPFLRANRRNVDLFNPPDILEACGGAVGNSNENKTCDGKNNDDLNFFLREEKNLEEEIKCVSHLSSNGYYGYCNVANLNKKHDEVTNMTDIENFEIPVELGRRKRLNENDDFFNCKRYRRFSDDLSDDFVQKSFDPNLTSIDGMGGLEVQQQQLTEEMDTDMPPIQQLSSDDLKSNNSQNYSSNNTNYHMDSSRYILTFSNNINNNIPDCISVNSQNNIFQNNFNFEPNLNNSNSSKDEKSHCDWIAFNSCPSKNINKLEKKLLLENLFMLTHGGNDHQMWHHFNSHEDDI